MTRHDLLQKQIFEALTAIVRLTLARIEAEHIEKVQASRKPQS